MNLFARHRNWPERRRVVAAGIATLAPDIVAFQEVVRTDGDDQLRDVLGDEYHVFHQRGRSEDGVGASIASRWQFTVLREEDLHVAPGGDPTGWIGSLVVAEVAAPEPIGRVLFAHHKPTWQLNMEHVRERQAAVSARVIEELVGGIDRHVVLAGDFDAVPEAASMRFWTGKQSLDGMSVGYQDTWAALHPDDPGATFTPLNPLRSRSWNPRPPERIDYVLVRCGAIGPTLDIAACELAFDGPIDGVWASDHFGVVADLVERRVTSEPS